MVDDQNQSSRSSLAPTRTSQGCGQQTLYTHEVSVDNQNQSSRSSLALARAPQESGCGQQISSDHEVSVDSQSQSSRLSLALTRSPQGSRCSQHISSGHEVSVDSDDHVQYPPPSRFRRLCRALGLQLLYSLWCIIRGKRSREEPKIAIRKDWGTAAAAASIHLLPVSAAVAICTINLHGYYIGDELAGASGQDDMKLGSLQLTAKLHELTMQASLAAVVFGYVRDQLALGEGIPFGAVFAGLHIKEISFFWSREFWGAMRSKYPDLRRRLELMLLLVIGTLLGVSVGPSSAIVLKPRIDDWPAGGTQFFLGATPQQLFPLQVNSSDMFPYCLGDHGYDECPSGNWRDLGDTNAEHWTRFSIASNDYPEVISLSSESAVRHLYHTAKTGLYGDRFTLATTQHAGLANALVDISRLWVIAAEKVGRGRFTSQRDVSFTIDGPGAQQPITLVSCAPMRIKNSRLLVSYQFPRIDSLEAYEGNDEEFPTARDNFTLSDVSYLETLDEPRLDWTHLPDSIFGGNSIGAVISIPATESYSALIYMCTVDSRWASVAIQSKRSQMTTVTGAPDGWLSSGVFNRSWPRINISTEWAAGLSPPVGNSSTVFEKLTRTAELRKLPISLPSPVQFPASQLGILAIEKILAIIVTNGLARVGYKTYLKGNLKGFDRKSDVFCAEWCEQMIPHGLMTVKKFNQRFGQAFESPVIGAYSAGSAGKWKLQVTVNGYAYSTRGLTMKIAVGILLTYSVVAVAHVVWLLKTGISSGCWDTAPEITVLALNSARTDMLRNTCSGIETTEPFKRTVRVVVRRGRHLEMIFGPVTRWVSGEKASDNDDDDVVGKVSKNEFYD